MESIEKRINDLVKEQFGKMKLSKKESNRARLINTCQSIVYNDWGFSSQNAWNLISENVEYFIPEEMD